MQRLSFGKIALILAEGDPDAIWHEEAAARAGLICESVTPAQGLDRLGEWQVVVLCGRGVLDGSQAALLSLWVERGGCAVATGGTWGLEERLGLTMSGLPRFARGVMTPVQPSSLWNEADERALFFGGARAVEQDARVYARGPEGEAAAAENGRWLWFAPHVGQSLRVMLMGRSVACDGIGPGDSSASLDDGIRRAEDGTWLSFESDRTGKWFGTAWAEVLVEAWARLVLRACDLAGQTPLLVSPWPSGCSSTAAISVDCEGAAEAPRHLASLLAKFGIKAGWMAPPAGLPKDLSRGLRTADHSFGLLFEAGTKEYTDDMMKLQMVQAARQFGSSALACSRPSDGRWEGWERFYCVLARTGARASLSKGGRQSGTSGFLFGAAAPFVPRLTEKGLPAVVELPYQACLPATPDSALREFAEESCRRCGCLHVVVNLNEAEQGALDRSIMNLNMTLRQNRTILLTPDQAVLFTLGLRTMSIAFVDQGLTASSVMGAPGATFLTDPRLVLAPLGGGSYGRPFHRFGRSFLAWSFDIAPRTKVSLRAAFEMAA